jgi:hypothetical protein
MTLTLARGVLRRPASLTILAAMVILAASDFYTDFWNDHSMLTSIVSSGLFVAIAIAIIDTWNRERELAPWRRVGNISFKAMAQCVIVARDGLAMFPSGVLPYPEDPTPQVDSCEQFAALINMHPELTIRPDRFVRLEHLLQDSEWVACAYKGVRTLASQVRDTLARWAPIMVLDSRTAVALNRVGTIADSLEDLHRPLGPLRRRDREGIDSRERRVLTALLWDETITAAVALEENLAQTMGRKDRMGEDWRSLARRLLSDDGLNRLNRVKPGDAWEGVERELNSLRNLVRMQYPSSHDTALANQGGQG